MSIGEEKRYLEKETFLGVSKSPMSFIDHRGKATTIANVAEI